MGEQALADLLRFWSGLDEKTSRHPDDHVPESLLPTLKLNARPVPWCGNLAAAKVYVLMLNPGYREGEEQLELEEPISSALMRNLRAPDSFFYLSEEFERAEHPGWSYWESKLQLRSESDDTLRRRCLTDLCCLELVPYHSIDFDLLDPLVHRLKSTRLMKAFLWDYVMPRTHEGVGVVVARSARYWGLCAADASESAFAAGHNIAIGATRSAWLSRNTEGGRLIRKLLL